MKTKNELAALREETENLKSKLAELTEEELTLVLGGNSWGEYWGVDDADGGSDGLSESPSHPGKWNEYWG